MSSHRRGTLIALILGFLLGGIVVLICWRQREGRPPEGPEQDPEAWRVTLPAVPRPVEPAAGRSEPHQGPDDLTRVEGIGPKISSLLEEAGIVTYEQLAASDPQALRHILRDEGLHFADPDTWPEQAALAAVGAWATLEELQDELSRGRRIT